MKKLVLSVPLLAITMSAGAQSTADKPAAEKRVQARETSSPQELFKRLAPSVFIVAVFDESSSIVAFGSGVAVAPDQVGTNKHVIEAGVSLRVAQGDKVWPAMLTHIHPDHDLCQLKVGALKARPVPVRASSTLAVGERVYAVGAPEGLELTLSEGIISGFREYEQARLIQTSAAISHGSSGGGLFDAQGRLVGITTFSLKEGQNLNFALPAEFLRGLRMTKLVQPEQASTGRKTQIEEGHRGGIIVVR